MAATALREGLGAAEGVVWAIGDLHGDDHCARQWVGRTGLVNGLQGPVENWAWTDDNARLVLMGDYIDKGPHAKKVLEFARNLTSRFPEQVTALMGNHELNLLVDRARPSGSGRYMEYAFAAAHPAQYVHWLPPEERTEATSRSLLLLYEALDIVYTQNMQASVLMSPDGPHSIVNFIPKADRQLVASELKRWQHAYLRGVSSASTLGRWLLERPLTTILADTAFVHGGIPLGTSRSDLAELNTALSQQTSESALDAFVSSHALAQELVEDRRLHRNCERVWRVASLLNVSRIAVGHTPATRNISAVLSPVFDQQVEHRVPAIDSVRVSCGGTLLALDSALGRWFRASGNYYCPGSVSSSACPLMGPNCDGQVVRLSRDGAADTGWRVEVVEMGEPSNDALSHAHADAAERVRAGGAAADGAQILEDAVAQQQQELRRSEL